MNSKRCPTWHLRRAGLHVIQCDVDVNGLGVTSLLPKSFTAQTSFVDFKAPAATVNRQDLCLTCFSRAFTSNGDPPSIYWPI